MLPTSTYLNAEVSVKNHRDLEKLLAFCAEQGFECAVEKTHVILDKVYRTPKPAFKALCGPEWLNAQGQINSEGAHAFLMKYVRNRGMIKSNGLITLNDTLNSIFGIQEQHLSEYTLMHFIESIFEDGHA